MVSIHEISSATTNFKENNIVLTECELQIERPAYSSLFNSFEIKSDMTNIYCNFSLSDIECKMVLFKIYAYKVKKFYVTPMVHSERSYDHVYG